MIPKIQWLKKGGKSISIGIYILAFVCFLFSIVATLIGQDLIFILLALSIGIPMGIIFLFHLDLAVYIILISSYFILSILRFIDLPLGIVIDLAVVLAFGGLLLQQIQKKDWTIVRNPISYLIIIWMIYLFIEIINPYAASKLAWLYTVRGLSLLLLVYFIALYGLNSYSSIKTFIKIWIFLSTLVALYGLYQEIFGLPNFELEWISRDEKRFALYYNWGRFRKFSFLVNPTIFGIQMAYTGILCIILTGAVKNIFKKLLLVLIAALMFISLVFSGTRTAYAIIPAGFIFYAILSFNKKTLILIGSSLLIGFAILISPIKSIGPITSNTLNRLRSAFFIIEDPSFNVRLENQEYIQPFILSHPMGGGLGSTGIWGQRFSPNSALAQFPPDSGYVRIAVEAGWIGLIIYCGLMFIILKEGIVGYHTIREPQRKIIYGGILSVIYTLIVANYAQEATNMYPTIIIFHVCISFMITLKKPVKLNSKI